MGDCMYVSSPDPIETDKMLPNRLDDFYLNESKCEFNNCHWTAKYHCCDYNLYWEGCGRVFCEDHGKSAKDAEEGEALAFVCIECHMRYKTWKYYSFCSLFLALMTFALLWKITTSETLPTFLSFMGNFLNKWQAILFECLLKIVFKYNRFSLILIDNDEFK